jgi:hypothetical protein
MRPWESVPAHARRPAGQACALSLKRPPGSGCIACSVCETGARLPVAHGGRGSPRRHFFTDRRQHHFVQYSGRGFAIMKIEIAESLMFSWLRHVHGCVVTQMNWKPSPSWPIANEHELRQTFERIRTLAGESIGIPIFKQCEFGQFVRQTEIDVLGFRLARDPLTSQAIAVDSAFHEAGLNYGTADETVGRVLKKLIRAALALEGYLNVREALVVFATPKVAEPIQAAIERHLANLDAVLADRASGGPRLRFRLIANGDFADEIVQPVLEAATTVADTSELFMRAQQLMALCQPPARQPRPMRNRAVPTERGEGIGAHVRATMTNLAESGRLTPETVAELSSARYCRQRFNLGYPLLKPVDPYVDLTKQRHDRNGYPRYWKHPLDIGGNEFLMCSQWFDWQRTAFDQWVRDLGGTPDRTSVSLASRSLQPAGLTRLRALSHHPAG